MKKLEKFGELAYIIGIPLLALGVCFMAKAGLGVSMVVAPAYILSLKVEALTFGLAEYVLQAVLLLSTVAVVGRFKPVYLLSFVTAILYGAAIDGWNWLLAGLQAGTWTMRILYFILGFLMSTASIALFFHTYLSPAVYELFVMEVSKKLGVQVTTFKMIYDLASCVVAAIMALLFFGSLKGVGVGTVVSALLNGLLIGRFSILFGKFVDFSPRFPALRKLYD